MIVYCTRNFVPRVMERACEVFDLRLNPNDRGMSRDEILTVAETGVQGFLTAGGDDFSADTISALPDTVKCLSTVSVGYDQIDVHACKKRGIRVGNTPEVLNDATADMAWLCVLGASRLAQFHDHFMRAGHWANATISDYKLGTDIMGKRLGILGMGNIGRIVAKRSQGWDMQVHYHNRSRLPTDLENGAIYHETPESLFGVSDILSLNCPLTPTSKNIINADTLKVFPKGAIIVNTARGGVVDDDALIQALQSGQIFAAGLDVFDNEPHFDKRYLQLDNVFLQPHVGSLTMETRIAMGNIAIDNIVHALSGTPMPHEVIAP